MFSKLGEAISLLIRHFGLIAAVVLTVWLPGNLLIGYINFFLPAPENELNAFRAAMFIEGIFGPIYIGAMIHALWQIKQEEAVGYGEALRVGFQNWGRLFAARFIAGIFILLGLIAFIVPGVVLTLRYAFLDSVVVLEEAGSDEARRRSTRLTEGLKLQILIMSTVFYIGFIVAAMMVYVPIALAEEIAQLGLPVAVLLEVRLRLRAGSRVRGASDRRLPLLLGRTGPGNARRARGARTPTISSKSQPSWAKSTTTVTPTGRPNSDEQARTV